MAEVINGMDERLGRLERELDTLKSRAEIHEILCSMARAADRGDAELQASCFHPNGTDYRGVVNGPYENCCETLRRWNATEARHCIQNVSIRFEGPDAARVETYVDAFHFLEGPKKGEGRFEFIQARYLDRFERRDDVWKIARRITVWDTSWLEPEKPSWYDDVAGVFVQDKRFMFSARGKEDLYYSYLLPEQFRHYEPDAKFA